MDTDSIKAPKIINGINLENYLPERGPCNSIVYTHKRCIEESKPKQEKRRTNELFETIKIKNKSQQFNSHQDNTFYLDKTNINSYNNEDSIHEQTIRIAKNMVPLVLPASNNKVIYTIKTAKKHKKKDKRPRTSSIENYIPFNSNKAESKKCIETYKKVKRESISVKESFSHSSNNTLDDLNINQSLCTTLSELSEKKYKKKKCEAKRLSQGKKFVISESFEAVATENTAGDGKIKIQLMNEQDKHFLMDSIKQPILNAIREYMSDLYYNNSDTKVSTVHNLVISNAQKLDNILHKLICIEGKLDDQQKTIDTLESKIDKNDIRNVIDMHAEKLNYQDKKLKNFERKLKIYSSKSERIADNRDQSIKPKVQVSALEELSENVREIKENYSSEEELDCEILDKRSKSTVVEELVEEDKCIENLGGGEVAFPAKKSQLVGLKLERPNRVPARFCWTDAGK